MSSTNRVVSSTGKRIRLGRVALFMGVSACSVLSLLAAIGDEQAFDQVSSFLQQVNRWLMVARLAAILSAWWYWDGLVDWMFRGGNQAGVEPLKAKRYALALFFVGFELVVVQNVIGHLIRWVS